MCPGQLPPVIQGPVIIRLCPRATFIPDNQERGHSRAGCLWLGRAVTWPYLVARDAGKCSPAGCP